MWDNVFFFAPGRLCGPVWSRRGVLGGDASVGAGPAGSETRPAPLPQPAVPQVAHRAPGRGEREGAEDPVHLPEGEAADPLGSHPLIH